MEVEKGKLKVEKISNELYEVYSDGKVYQVINTEGVWVCTCRGWYFNNKCKHIEAVLEFIENG